MTKVSLEHANTFSFQDPFTYSDSRMCLGPCFETEKLVSVVQFSFSDFSFLRTRACVGLLVRVSRRKRDRTSVVRCGQSGVIQFDFAFMIFLSFGLAREPTKVRRERSLPEDEKERGKRKERIPERAPALGSGTPG